MKKGTIIILVIVAVLAVLVIYPISNYNKLVGTQSAVEESQADIMAQLQRRADLIPNLVQTVNNYTQHETEVFAAVNAAREALLSAKSVPEMEAADGQMNTALGSLIAVAEAYPELTSSTVYTGLMDELAGTENRIAVARMQYNEQVQSYNLSIRRFPGVLFAKFFHFDEAAYFEADADAASVPSVS